MNERIKNYRQKLGITQKELADLLYISDKTVSRWESGKQLPEAQLIPNLAAALGVTVNVLYGIEETEPKAAAPQKQKPRYGVLLWYKILMTVGMLLALFAATGLAKFDIFYNEQVYNMGIHTVCWIQLIASAALLIGTELSYVIVTKHTGLTGGIYLRAEIVFSSLAALELVFIMWQLAFGLSVAYEIWYGIAAFAAAICSAALMLWQKKRLRCEDIIISRKISIISIVLICACVLGLAVVFIATVVHGQYMENQYTVAKGLESLAQQSENYYALQAWEHKVNFYSYLLAFFPVFSALILLHAENLWKSRSISS